MNRQHWKELLPVIEAFANGEDVETQDSNGYWGEVSPDLNFSMAPARYRIAPKPRTVFINECPNGEFSTWSDRATADLNATGDRIDCHEVQLPPLP